MKLKQSIDMAANAGAVVFSHFASPTKVANNNEPIVRLTEISTNTSTPKAALLSLPVQVVVVLVLFGVLSHAALAQVLVTNSIIEHYVSPTNTWANQTFPVAQFDPSQGLLISITTQYSCLVSCSDFALLNSSSSSESVTVLETNLCNLTGGNLNSYKSSGVLSGSGTVAKGPGYSFIAPSPGAVTISPQSIAEEFPGTFGKYLGTNKINMTFTWSPQFKTSCGTGQCTGISAEFGHTWQVSFLATVNYIYVPYVPITLASDGVDQRNSIINLTFNSVSNASYVVQATTNLALGTWSAMVTNISTNNVTKISVAFSPTNATPTFFRIRVAEQQN